MKNCILLAVPCVGQVSCLECSGGKRGETELILQTENLDNAGKYELLTVGCQKSCEWQLKNSVVTHSLTFLLTNLLFSSIICFWPFWKDSLLTQNAGPHAAILGKQNYHWLFLYMPNSYPLCFNHTYFF